MLEAEIKSGGLCGKNCYWISCAALSGLLMGIGQAVFAIDYADLGFEGGGLQGPGVLIVVLGIWIVRVVKYRCKTGSWTDKKKSRLVKTDGSLQWSHLIPLLGNATINVSYIVVMTYAWYFAELGGINQGVVSVLVSLASLINIVTFYFGFGEKIGWLNLIGIMFMIASVICIGAAAGSSTDDSVVDEESDSKTFNGVLGILGGTLGAVVVSLQAFLIRKFHS